MPSFSSICLLYSIVYNSDVRYLRTWQG